MRATSRTRTAPTPITATLSFIDIDPAASVEAIYGGAPIVPASESAFPGHGVAFSSAAAGVQIGVRFAPGIDGRVLVMLDLGRNQDVSRLELYGNLLTPAVESQGRPVHNFGLPHGLLVGAIEEQASLVDLHGRAGVTSFRGEGTAFRLADILRFETRDLRGLWGWTPVALPPTFGRYLLMLFTDLPLAFAPGGGVRRVLDIQRLVVFPFLEDVDHRPHVEAVPVSSRQMVGFSNSAYWTRAGEASPLPITHQSIGYDAQHDALLLPGALAEAPATSPAVGRVPIFASDTVPTDPAEDNRIFLILQATSDEVPLLEAVRLIFRVPEEDKAYQGPKVPSWPDYRLTVHTTNEPGAAFSPDPSHPAWRLAADERHVAASSIESTTLWFMEPERARWVRLTARPVAPSGVDLGGRAALMLHRVDLVRCRHFVLTAEPEEDLQVDHVLLRLRGQRLMDDYAYLDGRHGAAITVESAENGGPFEEIRRFRTLLELVESTHHRVLANHRRVDKPIQITREISRSASRSRSRSRSTSLGRHQTSVRPEFGNVQVTRSGTLTEHTDDPRNNRGDGELTGLPNETATGLVTRRTYEFDPDLLTGPDIDLSDPANFQPPVLFSRFMEWAAELTTQGVPVSVGLGGNAGASISIPPVLGGSGGVSVNVGTQIGGGVTESTVEGTQGTLVFSESRTVRAETRQDTSNTGRSRQQQQTRAVDRRRVERRDLSAEVRRRGVEVMYGGVHEDLILASIPIGRLLRGTPRTDSAWSGNRRLAENVLRVRIDHLPPGISLDVEFRGRSIPRPRGN
jgi:hypothetical protein